MEVVINKCYGGFGLSHAATMALAERKGIKLYVEPTRTALKIYGPPGDDLNEYRGPLSYFTVPPEQYYALQAEVEANGEGYKRLNEMGWYYSTRDVERSDPDLVAVVRELGDEAAGDHAQLDIVEVPDAVEWGIEEYDGMEWVAEAHRVWS
jgi:hypothetical protein